MKYALYALMLCLCGCALFESDKPEAPMTLSEACSVYKQQQIDRVAGRVQSLFDAARGSYLFFCDADPITQACVSKAIRFNAQVGATQALIELQKAKLIETDGKSSNNTFFLDHYFNVSHTYPVCRAAKASVDFMDCTNAVWVTQPFQCDFANTGKTDVNIVYDIAYINFPKKQIGAFYDVSVSGASQGGRSGYALIRFPNDPAVRPQEDDLDEIQFTINHEGQLISYTTPVPVEIEEQTVVLSDSYTD